MSFPNFLHLDSDTVARQLLGCMLVREIDGQTFRVKIVETESYDQEDAASHSYKPPTARTAVMFGAAGHLYVYFTYGMHYCCNVVTGPSGYGSGVLLRAVEPIDGLEAMEKRRGKRGSLVTNGPAKLCQALGIDTNLNGHDLRLSPLCLITGTQVDSRDVMQTTRVGISQSKAALRRYYISSSDFVSKR